MKGKSILIPLGQDSRDLKALYHALSLSARIQSKISVLFLETVSNDERKSSVIEACLDVIHNACEEGSQITFHIAAGRDGTELLSFLEREHVDLVIISDKEVFVEKMIKKIMPLISCQVVQVKEKNDINFLY